MAIRTFSKSKLLAFRQCPKRLWLELHRPELAELSAASQATIDTGHQVGVIAQALYDPSRQGAVNDLETLGVAESLARTLELLKDGRPIFEAGFEAKGVRAFADVLLPDLQTPGAWRMVEVKSAASVKDYHRDDVAIQAYVARASGLALSSVAVAHIDSSWTYPGGGDYRGLLREAELTEEAFARAEEVQAWVSDAQAVAAQPQAPKIDPGPQCSAPFACGFTAHCHAGRPMAEHPVQWLPNIRSKALKAFIEANPRAQLGDVPDALLNEQQRRVRDCTLRGTVYFDQAGARADLAQYGLPALFMDFETYYPAVPIWAGTRPFQQVPFQFSVHRLGPDGQLFHTDFLDLSGTDPRRAFTEQLLVACAGDAPVFVYNAAFEATRLRELADAVPALAAGVHQLRARLVDLLPVAERRYYHPSQQGSWSIKKVLPALVPELRYDDLNGVADGGAASQAFAQALHPNTSPEMLDVLRRQLLAYCGLDTLAMVRVWEMFTSRSVGPGLGLVQHVP